MHNTNVQVTEWHSKGGGVWMKDTEHERTVTKLQGEVYT